MRNQQHQHRIPLQNGPIVSEPLFCEGEGVCLTCSDEALPARVLSVVAETGLALVEIDEATTEIDVTLVEAVAAGEWLLTHGGVALGRLEEHKP